MHRVNDFKGFILNEGRAYLGIRIGDILNAIQDLEQNAKGMGTRQMVKNAEGKERMGWHKLLKGRTARVIVTSGTHPWLIYLFFGDYTNEIRRGILWFAGFKTKLTKFGPAEHAPEWKLNEWRRKIVRLGNLGE